MVRRRASQVSRSAVSTLIGPAPSSTGGASSLRCTISVVGLRRIPSPLRAPQCWASVTSASAVDCCHSSTVPSFLSIARCSVGDVPDGLLERGALLERQPAAEHELALAARPGHAQRAPLVELLVVLDLRRHDRARRECDLTGRLADRDARELGVARGGRELGGGCDLVERQRAGAQGVVERRQAAQRAARARDAHGAAVVAARDLCQPLRARGAPRGLPVAIVVGLAHDLRDALLDARFLLRERAQLASPRLAATLTRLIDRPIH